jgi:hypothetical protein
MFLDLSIAMGLRKIKMGDVELAGAGLLVDAVEADRLAGPAPAGVEIAAQVAGDVASNFHVESDKRSALFSFDVVEDQRLVQPMFAIGDQPVAVRPESAMTVEIEHALA